MVCRNGTRKKLQYNGIYYYLFILRRDPARLSFSKYNQNVRFLQISSVIYTYICVTFRRGEWRWNGGVSSFYLFFSGEKYFRVLVSSFRRLRLRRINDPLFRDGPPAKYRETTGAQVRTTTTPRLLYNTRSVVRRTGALTGSGALLFCSRLMTVGGVVVSGRWH